MGKSKYGMVARLVWDGGDEVRIPEELGTPAPNQMLGTPGERLSEVSGRTCYDSLGRGRSSEEYHKHILDVKHGSVYEHFNMTVRIELPDNDLAVFLNRPGIWTRVEKSGDLAVTLSPRSVLDWDYWSKEMELDDLVGSDWTMGAILSYHMERACPNIVTPRVRSGKIPAAYDECSKRIDPVTHEQKWISMFMVGSRGFSHEQVRHKFRTGVSQRSTRFVNEDESPWFDHPLVQEFLKADVPTVTKGCISSMVGDTVLQSRRTYVEVNDTLYAWLLSRGVDKTTARKQARGAARGYLGNALSTELIFSASAAQWKRMLRMRCSAPADAEIRADFVEVLTELKKSRYADEFKDFDLVPAQDGLGSCSVEKAQKEAV